MNSKREPGLLGALDPKRPSRMLDKTKWIRVATSMKLLLTNLFPTSECPTICWKTCRKSWWCLSRKRRWASSRVTWTLRILKVKKLWSQKKVWWASWLPILLKIRLLSLIPRGLLVFHANHTKWTSNQISSVTTCFCKYLRHRLDPKDSLFPPLLAPNKPRLSCHTRIEWNCITKK